VVGAESAAVPDPNLSPMGSLSERRDQDAEQRDQDAQNRDLTNEQRDRLAGQRDQSADQRDLRGEQRDLNGEQRDLDAEQRDLDAERRDREAGRRDIEADKRDHEAELRDSADANAANAPSSEARRRSSLRRREAALDRRDALRDRAEAATGRDRAGLDRGTALADRVAGASGRDSAGIDRGTALADRVAGASGRDSAGIDRGTAMDDRAASATDRQYASQLASSLVFGWTVRQLDPPQLLYVSPGYLRILGLPQTRSDLTLAQALAMVHPEDVASIPATYWHPATDGPTEEAELRIIRPDGETRWIRTVSSPVINTDGTITRAATTVEDVTERKDAEAAVRLAQELAERANAAKSDFLSRMSHELRTPLNAVLGFAQLLALDPLSPSQVSAIDEILSGGRHLLEMIEEVLDMSRIDTGRLAVTSAPVSIADLLVEVVTVMTPAAAANQIHIGQDAWLSAADSWVLGDRHRLRQVLLQLVSNGVKYNQPAGRVQIKCTLLPNTGELRVSVADTGCGIRSTDIAGLAIPFERSILKRSDIEGAGIGLALSFRLAAIMGGRIDVQSEFGSGSTFSLTMPRAEAPRADMLLAAAP
jgi:PAS domain S-box-containing protein